METDLEIEKKQQEEQRKKRIKRNLKKLKDTDLPKKFWKVNIKNCSKNISRREVFKKNFLLTGVSGAGKTHTIACMIKKSLKNSRKIKYISDSDYFCNWQNYNFKKLKEEIDVVFIDDLGLFSYETNKVTYQLKYLQILILERFNKNLPTHIATTLNITEILYKSIQSRIINTYIKLNCGKKDKRKFKK